jgi:drug/metabolite transporter (DMT)-like permease
MLRRRIAPVVLIIVGVALIAAGFGMWREMSPRFNCPNLYCAVQSQAPHRLHPLRAEMLWLAGALSIVLGATWTARQMRPPSTPSTLGSGTPVSGS